MPRRKPADNRFCDVAPFIRSDAAGLVYVGKFSGGYVIVAAGQADLFRIRRSQLDAYNEARSLLSYERRIARLKRAGRCAMPRDGDWLLDNRETVLFPTGAPRPSHLQGRSEDHIEVLTNVLDGCCNLGGQSRIDRGNERINSPIVGCCDIGVCRYLHGYKVLASTDMPRGREAHRLQGIFTCEYFSLPHNSPIEFYRFTEARRYSSALNNAIDRIYLAVFRMREATGIAAIKFYNLKYKFRDSSLFSVGWTVDTDHCRRRQRARRRFFISLKVASHRDSSNDIRGTCLGLFWPRMESYCSSRTEQSALAYWYQRYRSRRPPARAQGPR